MSMEDQLISTFKSICACVSGMEEGHAKQNDDKFYNAMSLMDIQLDELRKRIEELTGKGIL